MERRAFLKGTALATVVALGGSLTASITPEVVLWQTHAPVLDQGQIGDCTGNAVTQLLNTDYAMKISGRKSYLTEDDAIKIYTLATDIDSFPGSYPTADTGSSGSAACEAAMRLGYLTGYTCVGPTLPLILSALRLQPLIVGTSWMSEMITPQPSGLVTTGGYYAGGHEFALLGFDAGEKEFTFLNSWTSAWGDNGRFRMKYDDFINLLAGDTTAINAPTVKPAT